LLSIFYLLLSTFKTEDTMNFSSVLSLSLPIAVGLAAFGSALGLGKAVATAMEAMGRQPEAANKIQTGMIIGCAFIEALTIYALLVVLLLQGKIS
jgi:F-type H+-transporting ATPase subunit c